MHQELENAAGQLLDQEDKIKEANQTALELLNQLKEADHEIEQLRGRIKQLQGSVYTAVKGDVVDEALGNYINYDAKGPLEVMFIRLQPGIYSFGSKKVCIKVENGKINIRVGGGYMVIDEFLEKFTVIEVDKHDAREAFNQGSAETAKISPSKRQ